MALSRYKYLAAALLAMACGTPEPVRTDYAGGALGTTYAITVFTDRATDLQPGIDSVFAAVNRSMSTYMPESDISRINAGDTTVVTDAMFREVLSASREIHRATAGAFDPTVGVLVDAWGFGPGEALEMTPERVDSLLQYVGLEKVSVTADNRIRKSAPGIRLDFNAIAKGYTIDRLAAMLDAAGSGDYLIEVGGEVRARGRQLERGQPWRVGIDDPQAETDRTIKRVVTLTDRSMATSGNYRKFRIDPESGTRYVHTMDALTGYPRTSNVLAVSVIAPDCMTADGYATALMALELDAGRALLAEAPDLEAYIIYADRDGATREFMTEGFARTVSE